MSNNSKRVEETDLVEVIGESDLNEEWAWKRADVAMKLLLNRRTMERLPDLQRLLIDSGTISSLDKVAHLDLSLNHITTLSRVQSLHQLRSLDCSRNLLVQLYKPQPYIGHLSQLRELNLSNNRLIECRGLDTLSNLITLDLSTNRIERLSNISSLTRLKTLNVTNNQLDRLDGIRKLVCIETLLAQRNRIHDVSSLAFLVRLRHLNLAENKLTDLHHVTKALSAVDDLKTLHLWDNEITKDDLYRITVLDAAAPEFLDGQQIRPYVRRQIETLQTRQSAVATEYTTRISQEESLLNAFAEEMKKQLREAEAKFSQYRYEMNQELREAISFLHQLRVSSGGEGTWLLSQEGLQQWKQTFETLEQRRVEKIAETKQQLKEAQRLEAQKTVKSMSMVQKLYQISLKKPQIWQAMKQREIEMNKMEEQAEDIDPTTVPVDRRRVKPPLPATANSASGHADVLKRILNAPGTATEAEEAGDP